MTRFTQPSPFWQELLLALWDGLLTLWWWVWAKWWSYPRRALGIYTRREMLHAIAITTQVEAKLQSKTLLRLSLSCYRRGLRRGLETIHRANQLPPVRPHR